MYSGHMLDGLMQLVARAEENARELKASAEEEQADAFYAQAFLYEAANQQALAGVA